MKDNLKIYISGLQIKVCMKVKSVISVKNFSLHRAVFQVDFFLISVWPPLVHRLSLLHDWSFIMRNAQYYIIVIQLTDQPPVFSLRQKMVSRTIIQDGVYKEEKIKA